MNIIDEGVLLSKNKFGESSTILTIFTKQHGIQKGLLKGGYSGKNRSFLEIGNILKVHKKARLEESLGILKIELQESFLMNCFNDPLKILILTTICQIIQATILEKEEHHNFYKTTKAVLEFISLQNDKKEIIEKYIQWEVILLKEIGFGLDLSKCVVTNKLDGLYYLSPRTGKSVIKEVGDPYKEKLFKIPEYLKDNIGKIGHNHSYEEYVEGFNITTYFINRLVNDYNVIVPEIRNSLINKALTISKSIC